MTTSRRTLGRWDLTAIGVNQVTRSSSRPLAIDVAKLRRRLVLAIHGAIRGVDFMRREVYVSRKRERQVEDVMSSNRVLFAGVVALGFALIVAGSQVATTAQQSTSTAVAVDNNDIGGIVTARKDRRRASGSSPRPPDLPTKLVKIVVTDDQGRYLLPDLPKATYDVWVRGYGLVDSPKVQSAPGKALNLKAVVAPNARAAAEYYPAGYWFSLINVPGKHEFPGTGDRGNGIAPTMRSQAEWLRGLKNGGCWGCHQLGNKATREIPEGARQVSHRPSPRGSGACSPDRPAKR